MKDVAKSLRKQEEQIEAGLVLLDKGRLLIGAALITIRDEQLYRQSHPTLEAYLKDRWDRSRDWGYKLIKAETARSNVELILHRQNLPSPKYTSLWLELARLPAAVQPQVWELAIESYGEQPTTADLRAIVDDYLNGDLYDGEPENAPDASESQIDPDPIAVMTPNGGQTDGSNNADSTVGAGSVLDHSGQPLHGEMEAGQGASDRSLGSAVEGAGRSQRSPTAKVQDRDGGTRSDGKTEGVGAGTDRPLDESQPKPRPPEEVVDVEPVEETTVPREPQKPRPKKKPRTDPHAIAVEELAFIKQAGDQYLKELLSKGIISSKDILSVDGSELTLDEYRVRRCAAFARVFHTLRATERVADAPPTLDEFLAMAREMELPTERAEEFYFYQASTGWLNGTKWMIDIIAGYRHFLSRPWVKNPPKTYGKSGWGSDIPFEELA